MKDKKKIIIIAAAVLVLCLAVGGSLAYFTDKTEEAQNTFTIGKVDIDLTETSTDGTERELEENFGFSYEKCMPGSTYDKQPVVTLEEDSQPAWVFAEISVNDAAALNEMIAAANEDEYKDAEKKLATDNLAEVFLGDFAFTESDLAGAWTDTEEDKSSTFHIVYLVTDGKDGKLDPGESLTLFKSVSIPAELDKSLSALQKKLQESGKPISLNIKAYAIQQENVEDEATAYSQFFDASTYMGVKAE